VPRCLIEAIWGAVDAFRGVKTMAWGAFGLRHDEVAPTGRFERLSGKRLVRPGALEACVVDGWTLRR
jgi:hypothetical protein